MSYDTGFYDLINRGSLSSARVVVPIVLDAVRAASVLDVGCGEGAWLSVYRDSGCSVTGVDGDYVQRERLLIDESDFVAHDLSGPFDMGRRFDLVTSLEVAEHLPEHAADQFVATLTRHSPVVLFSAAIPGQGGVGHLNEQWPEYWAAKFAEHGYAVSGALRWAIWDEPDVENWYAQNLMLCVERSAVAGRPGIEALLDGPLAPMWPVVHPVLWRSRVS